MNHQMSDAELHEAVHAQRVASVMTRYGLACDERDRTTLEQLFHPDARAVYDVDSDVTGNTAIAEWIAGATEHLLWQQHAMRVMKVDVEGDRATAVSYLTSHQVAKDATDVTLMMNSRYDTELELLDGAWRIRRLHLVVGTIEHRPIILGSLAAAVSTEEQHV